MLYHVRVIRRGKGEGNLPVLKADAPAPFRMVLECLQESFRIGNLRAAQRLHQLCGNPENIFRKGAVYEVLLAVGQENQVLKPSAVMPSTGRLTVVSSASGSGFDKPLLQKPCPYQLRRFSSSVSTAPLLSMVQFPIW